MRDETNNLPLREGKVEAFSEVFAIQKLSVAELRAEVSRLLGLCRQQGDQLRAIARENAARRESSRASLNLMEDATRAEKALRESETALRGQSKALGAALGGTSLAMSLGPLLHAVMERLGKQAQAGFYVTEDFGGRLCHVVGMPEEYTQVEDGLETGPESLACGRDTQGGAPVLTADVTSDPRWKQWRWLAERFHYRACWCFPILTSEEKIVGVLAIYFPEPRTASAADCEFAAALTKAAAIIISHQRQSEQLTATVAALRGSEARVRATEERLRLIVDSALEHAILSLDAERIVTTWNPGAESIFGYTSAEAIGQTADMIFTQEDRAADVPGLEMCTALEKGRANDDRWMRRKDGTCLWANGAMLPMRAPSQGGKVPGFVKILRDETEKHEAKRALEESREQLLKALQETGKARAEAEAANALKDQFFAMLSHELRTPLTPVLIAVSMLQEEAGLSRMGREALGMMERNVLLEARLVDDLLDVTRIRRGLLEVNMEPIDLHLVIQHAIEVCRTDMAAKKHALSIGLTAGRHEVNGDAARLQQVVWNLLKNACKFTPEEGNIAVRTRNVENQIIIEVADDGIGLDPSSLAKIFDPFVQAHDRGASSSAGLGLGLAISKATVEAHGGAIMSFSKGRGKGAKFEVVLPLAS